MNPTTARDWLQAILDPGWVELFDDVVGGDPLEFPGYAQQLADARAHTGCSESVIVAEGTIDGRAVITISFEFGFLGGSMGTAGGERICRAFEHAATRAMPVIALTASGGARMQEGMLALATMPATLQARAGLADAHQPFIAYLRNPTTGGVFASFANAADLIWAQPGATIGFAGPRVAEAFTGAPLPEGSHTAEAAKDAGLIDAAIAPETLKAAIGAALSRTRVEIAMDGTPTTTSFYRRARRAIASAGALGLPIVTFIDTPGADPSADSERDGIAREIALTFDALARARVPTVCVVTGTGGSGGALALAACDRLLMLEDATFSVIAPKGAAAILRRTDVGQVARDLKITAADLKRFGLADAVVARAHLDEAIVRALEDINAEGAPTPRRARRWRILS